MKDVQNHHETLLNDKLDGGEQCDEGQNEKTDSKPKDTSNVSKKTSDKSDFYKSTYKGSNKKSHNVGDKNSKDDQHKETNNEG